MSAVQPNDRQLEKLDHVDSGASTPAAALSTLDVRGMDSTEILLRTFIALDELTLHGVLEEVSERVPRALLPWLEELGFTYELRQDGDRSVRIIIRRRDRR